MRAKKSTWAAFALGASLASVPAAAGERGAVTYFPRQGVACRPAYAYGPLTAAHRTLPCGTKVRATTRRGSAVFTVVDRGPWVPGVILDVDSGAGARALGLIGPGRLPVTIEVVR
jgi:rare lipoprotein A